MWGKTDLQFSCYTCGMVKYGEPAIRQTFEVALAKWERQQREEASFQAALDKERIERVAREAKQEAERKAQEEARLAREAEEEQERLNRLALRLAQEELERVAREEQARLDREREEAVRAQEEAARKVREEQERVFRERDAARIVRERELARERAARWSEIEVMRKRDAVRQANLQRELKRERDTRYRANKRARLAASPVAVLPVPAPLPAVPVVVEVGGVVEEVGSVSLPMCAWTGCANHATPSSKYCSRTCSNNNARARYAARRAELPAPAPEAKGEVNAELRKAMLARKARYETRTTTESA